VCPAQERRAASTSFANEVRIHRSDHHCFALRLFSRNHPMPSSSEVYTKLTSVLVDALGVEEDAIEPGAALQADLGAESIDFLDIVFRLERAFSIRIPRGELFPDHVLELCAKIVRDGRATAADLAALRSQMPYADLSALERDRRLDRIDDLFTVDLLARYVVWKLGGDGQAQEDSPATAAHHFGEDQSTTLMQARVQS
jgi:acyl carrier protein